MQDFTTSSWVDCQGQPIRKVWLLERVSGDKQEQEQTIKTQHLINTRFCQSQGWVIVGTSADENCQNEVPLKDRRHGRELWQHLAHPDFQAIVLYTVDRWSREPWVFWPEYHYALHQGVRCISSTQAFNDLTAEGRAMMGVLITFGSYEKSQITQKFSSGKKRVLEERYRVGDAEYGYWLGGVVPYGFLQVEFGRRQILILDTTPIEGLGFSPSEIVLLIFRWCAEERMSARRITERLNAMGVPPHSLLPGAPGRYRRGERLGLWRYATVSKLIRSTIYYGEHFYGKMQHGAFDRLRGTPRPMPSIVSRELFEAAGKVLDEHRLYSVGNKKLEYLLSGKIRCQAPGCGYGFYGRGNSPEGRWRTYNCISVLSRRERRALGIPDCPCHSLRAAEIEGHVLDEIQRFIDSPGGTAERLRRQLSHTGDVQEEIERQLGALTNQLADYGRQRQTAERQLIAGRLSDESFDQHTAEIRRDERHLEQEIAAQRILLTRQQELSGQIDAAADFLSRLRQDGSAIRDWPFERQRELVRLWLDRIEVYPPGMRREEQSVDCHFWPSEPIAVNITSAGDIHSYGSFLSSHLVCRGHKKTPTFP